MITIESGVSLPNNPRIGWSNIVTAANVTSDEAANGYPITELANSITYAQWRGTTTGAQTIVITLGGSTPIDYFAIARHNLGSAGIEYTLESSANGADWTTIVTGAPADDSVLIHAFAPVTAPFYRLSLSSGSAAPRIGILYLGEILVLERRIYVSHTPINMGRSRSTSTGRSDSGQFLGRVRRSEILRTKISVQNLSPDWVRTNLDPFLDVADITPFFWAWRPEDYPEEIAFCWTDDDGDVSNQRPNGMMQFDIQISGLET